MVTMVGGVTTASTRIETPVTLASMRVALLGLLVALAIVDCTEAAVAGVVWMITPTMTLADNTVNSMADGSTLARVAIAFFISVRTFGVNEEMSPSSKRVNATRLSAGGEGGESEGEGGEGEGGGGEGGGGSVVVRYTANRKFPPMGTPSGCHKYGPLQFPLLYEPVTSPVH